MAWKSPETSMETTTGTSSETGNWTPTNTKIILNWITVGSYSIEILEKCINMCRKRIRLNNFISLGFSTASGSLSITSYNKNDYRTTLVISILMTILSFCITISGGFIKVYQFQERLELYVKTKQEWVAFISELSSVVDFKREDALEIIRNNSEKYKHLLSVDYELFPEIKRKYSEMETPTTENISNEIVTKKSGFNISSIVLTLVKKHLVLLQKQEKNESSGNENSV